MSQHIKHRVIKKLFKNSYPYEAIDTNCTRSASLDIGSSCGTLRPTITQSLEYEHAITTSRHNHVNGCTSYELLQIALMNTYFTSHASYSI